VQLVINGSPTTDPGPQADPLRTPGGSTPVIWTRPQSNLASARGQSDVPHRAASASAHDLAAAPCSTDRIYTASKSDPTSSNARRAQFTITVRHPDGTATVGKVNLAGLPPT